MDLSVLKKKKLLFLAIVFIAGIILRLAFFSSTDMTWDEAFHVIQAFRIASVFIIQPVLLTVLLLAAIAVIYFALIRRSLKIVLLGAIAAVLAKFAFDIPVAFHPRHPPLFNFVTSAVIFLTNISPDVAGKIVSTVSLLALAVVSYFFGKKFFSEKFGLILSAFLILSPLSIFYSSTAFLNPMAVSLAFTSLMLFFYGLQNTKMLPLSGLLFSAAIATNYTVLVLLPIFAVLLFLDRKKLVKNEHLENAGIFVVLVLATLIIFLPSIISSATGYQADWQEGQNKVFVEDIAHYSASIAGRLGGIPLQPRATFFLETLSIFFSPAIFLLFLLGALYAFREKNFIVKVMAVVFLLYLAYFSMQLGIQFLRYALIMEFPLLFVSAFGLSNMKNKTAMKLVFGLFAAFFLLQSIVLLVEHSFTGLSKTVYALPDDSKIYTSFIDPVKYYSLDYVSDSSYSNKFLSRFLTGIPKEQRIFYSGEAGLSEIEGIDYAILTKPFFEQQGEENLAPLKKCKEITEGKYTLFWVYGKDCSVFSND